MKSVTAVDLVDSSANRICVIAYPQLLFWKYSGICPHSIIHIGAHLAEEHYEYKKFNWIGTESRIAIWVEAQTELVEILKKTLEALLSV